MRRSAWIGSWTRVGLQVGILVGLGLAFVGGGERPVRAGADCGLAERCGFKKPNLMFVLDDSSSMNAEYTAGQTAWEAAVEAIEHVITTDCGFIEENMHLALMRFGHDPDPSAFGTALPGGLVDGQALDVHWYDPFTDPQGWSECNGQEIVDALDALPAPLCLPGGPPPSNCAGIGSWTNGALEAAQQIIAQTRQDHPSDLDPGDERTYSLLLITDGEWTGPGGSGQPVDENPALTAAALHDDDGVRTYVLALGDAASHDEIATAGGTTAAIQPDPGMLLPAIEEVVGDIAASVIDPVCAPAECGDDGTSDDGESSSGGGTTGEPATTGDGGDSDSGMGVLDSSGASDPTGGPGETAGGEGSSGAGPGPMTTTPAPTSGTPSDPDTDTDGAGAVVGDGCGCSTDRDAAVPRWPFVLAMVGLLGVRRRSASVSPRARGTR